MTATIVIPAWNCWEQTSACLDALEPALAAGHRVVVVDNGSTDGTAVGLAGRSQVQVITNTVNAGFAAACNQGARWALEGADDGDAVVFLNNDTVPVGAWLDELLAVLDRPGVGAVGPRSNFVSGPQVVADAGYGPPGGPRHRLWEAAWASKHRGMTRPARRLVGFALAVRAGVLRQVGFFDESFGLGGYEDDDLCDRIAAAGWALLIADGAYVHHEGHASFDANGLDWERVQQANAATIVARRAARRAGSGSAVLLSACLIVKDEEANLVDCLRGLNGVVDEVVVYDTGSTDGTVALARRFGARVEEGFWDDDFARARNAALGLCSGTWILHVDADEVLETDPRLLRGVLEADPPVDALTVEIYNLVGDGSQPGYTHRGTRLFRRERCHWNGRLHEQVMLRPGLEGLPVIVPLTGLRILHAGYLDEAVAGHDKLARNLHLAEVARRADDGPSAAPGLVELNLGRSLAAVGRFADAVERYAEADAVIVAEPAWRMARMHAAEAYLALRRPTDALTWIERLRSVTARPGIPDVLEAQARLQLGEADRAVELARAVEHTDNEDGYCLPGGAREAVLAGALLAAGEVGEAADVLLGLIERSADVRTVTAAADTLRRAGRSLVELARVLPESGLLRAAAALTLIDADEADSVADELFVRFGPRPAVLAAAVRFAPRLRLERTLVWSARLRQAGVTADCPTTAQAIGHPRADRRALAAGALHAVFADPAGPALLSGAVADTGDDDLAGLIGALGALGALDGAVLDAAATTPARCLLLAGVLRDGDAPDVADVLEAHAARLGADRAGPAAGVEPLNGVRSRNAGPEAQIPLGTARS